MEGRGSCAGLIPTTTVGIFPMCVQDLSKPLSETYQLMLLRKDPASVHQMLHCAQDVSLNALKSNNCWSHWVDLLSIFPMPGAFWQVGG